jgi:hypothetical protein
MCVSEIPNFKGATMARDPRKNAAFDSGMRGSQKPKVQAAHGGTAPTQGSADGNSKQQPGGRIGDNTGVDLSAYTSGMRGPEKPKQKPASGAANFGQEKEGASGGENKQGPDTRIGHPDGHNDAGTGPRRGVQDSHLRQTPSDAKKLGIPGNNTEAASQGQPGDGAEGILGEEDDTHINIRIPKASLKKKNPGLQTN